MSRVVVYAMEFPTTSEPYVIEMDKEAAVELLKFLMKTPKHNKEIARLTKQLKRVLAQ